MPSAVWTTNAKNLAIELDLHRDCTRPWEWPTVNGTMFVGHGVIVSGEYAEMKAAGVEQIEFDEEPDAPNLVHQRYHFWRWQKMNPDLKLSEIETICEFGPGYGASIIVASRLGFRGDYWVEDLDIFHTIRERHLAQRDISCRVHKGVHSQCDLLMAVCSLSESPEDERFEYLARLKPKSWLLVSMGTDNVLLAWAQKQTDEHAALWHVEAGAPMSHLTYLTSYRGKR